MRTSAMVLAAMAALGLAMVGCDKKKTDGTPTPDGKTADGKKTPDAAKNFAVDPWTSWQGCKEGSSVTFETETSGMKMTTSKTLDKKGDPEHTLKTEMTMKVGDTENKTPGEEKVAKLKTGGANADAECPLCKKKYSAHKDESKWSTETLKIDGKDVKCDVNESAAKNCKGEDNPASSKMKMWYSNDVPGQLVKMEMPTMKMTLIKFEKK